MGKYVEVLAQELEECKSKLLSVEKTMDSISSDIKASPVKNLTQDDIDDIVRGVWHSLDVLIRVTEDINRKEEVE